MYGANTEEENKQTKAGTWTPEGRDGVGGESWGVREPSIINKQATVEALEKQDS